MANNSGQYSKTIKLKTLMDTNDVIQGLRKIREELNSTTSSKARGILGSVDTDLIKLEKIASSLQTSLAKGFSSNKDVAAFDKNLDSIITHVLEVREQLQKATTMSMADLPKKLDQDLDKIAKKAKALTDKYRAQMITAATNANIGDRSPLMKIIKNSQIEESMFDKRKEDLKAEIELNNEKLKQLKQEAAERAKISKIEAYAKSSIFAKTAKGDRQAFTDYFRPAKENMGAQGQSIRIFDEQKGKYLPQFNGEALKVINQTYSQELLRAAKSGKNIDINQLYNEIVKSLKDSYGILIQNNMAKSLRSLVASDVKGIMSAGQSITPSDLKLGKEANTLNRQNTKNREELNAIETMTPIVRQAAMEYGKLNEEEAKVTENNKKMAQTYEVVSQDMTQMGGQISRQVTGWENIRKELLTTAETQNKVDSGFSEIARRMTYLFSAASVFNFIRRQITATFQDVQKLDKSFAQIAMVTKYHVSDMWQNYDQYAAMANKLGQETNDVVQASVLFYQQGLETNEVLQLTEDTMKLATLAGTDFAEATDLMTAALRGFKLEMSEGSHVTDVYSELAAHAAASVNEIATAMNKTAAIANSAGMSFENTAAFLTQMIETTQESAANIGTALKTVIARFTELKENVDKSESEFDDLDYNKVDKALKSVGISLKDDVGQFRNLDEVFMELSKTWGTLSRNEQRYIATTAAGSRQQSRFIALMDNYQRTLELVEIAQNSEGRSSQQFAKYAESVEFKIKRLKNTWEQFRVSLLNSKVYKGAVDLLNNILGKISKFDIKDWIGVIAIFTTIGRKAASNFLTGWQSAINGLAGSWQNRLLKTNQDSRFSIAGTGFLTGLGKENQGIAATLIDKQDKGIQLSEDEQKTFKTLQAKAQSWYSSIGNAAGMAFTTAFTSYMLTDNPGQILKNGLISGATTAVPAIMNIFTAERNAGTGLWASLGKGLLGGATSFIISMGITAAAAGLKKFNNYLEETAEEQARANYVFYDAQKNLEALNRQEEKLQNTLSEKNSVLEKNKKEYDQLIKSGEELKELDKKALLTTEEKERYVELSNELVETYPTLLDYYDKENTAVVNLTDAYEKLVSEKEKAYRESKIESARATYELAINDYLKSVEQFKIDQDLANFMGNGTLAGNAAQAIYNTYDPGTYLPGIIPGNPFSLMYEIKASGLSAVSILDYLDDSVTATLHGTQEDAIALADYFKKVLKDSSTFSQIQNQYGYDVLSTIKEIVSGNKNNLEELQYYMSKTSDNYEINLQNIKQNTQKANKALEDYLGSLLETTNYYNNIEDKNAQAAVRRTILARNNIDLTKLINDFNEQPGNRELNTEVWQEKFNTYLQQTLDNIPIDEEVLSNTISEDIIKAWHQITLKVGDNPDFEKYLKLVISTDFGTEEDTKEQIELFYQQNKQRIDEINANKARLSAALHEWVDTIRFTEDGQGYLYTFKENSFGEKIEQLGENAKDRFYKGFNNAADNKYQEEFINDIKSLAEFLTPEDFQTLMSQDWDNYTLLNAKEFWQSMVESFTGDYSEDFEDKFGDIVTKIFTNVSANSTALLEDIEEHFNELETNISTYGKALKSALENGYIDATSLKALYKANAPLDKIINEDSTANIDELKKWVREQLESSDALIDNIKIEEELELDRLEAIAKQYEVEQNITKELLYQQAIQQGFSYDQAKNIADRYGDQTASQMLEDIANKRALIDEKARKYAEALMRASWGSYYDIEKESTQITEDNIKKIEDAKKAVSEAYDDILKKQQDLIDKQKELNDVLYGTSTHKSSLDLVYNYQTALDSLADRISQAKDILSDLDGKSPTDYINTIINATHGRVAYLTAQNDVYRNAITNTEGNLNTQLAAAMRSLGYNENPSKYIQYNKSLDRYLIDERLQSRPINDDLKNFIEEQGKLLNEYKEAIFKNDEEIRKEQKEFLEYQKQVRDNYLSVEEAVVEKLKEYYQEEIDNKKEMYDALSEADNKYLEALEKAINKQKELRDRQNKWNDLAEKEKKYSLLSRDTSGANQKETLKLQKDIEKDRTSLLDESVNSVIDELKDLYELQKETRDTEIEYQQSLLENSNLVQEANAIMQSWKSIDDLMDWMYEHTEGIENMSDAAIEKLSDDWKTMFDNIEVYNELQQAEVSEMFNLTQSEIQSIITGTSELLTSESSRAIAEIKEQVSTAIKNATQAVTDAMKALTDAQTKYNEAIKTYNDLINNGSGNGSGDGGKVKTVITDKDYAYSQFQADNGIGQQFNDAQRAQIERTQQAIENIILANEEDLQKYGYVNYGPLDTISQQMLDTVYEKSPIAANIEGYLYSFKDLAAYNKMLYEGRLKPLVPERSSIEGLVNPSATHYATGGLVNYTGPAWVDGTPTKPEAFLSAEDTARIGEAANIFKEIASLGTNGTISSGLVSVGGNNIELHVHVDSIATEAQVDYLIDRMKEEIVDAARPIGSSVML